MKQIHAARTAFEAHAVCGFLASHGIEADVRGEFLTSGWGELPVDVCSVWIRNERQLEAAQALLNDYLHGSHARKYSGERWTCTQCGEVLEGQFTQCWRCGAARP